jgi:hypothetical protein
VVTQKNNGKEATYFLYHSVIFILEMYKIRFTELSQFKNGISGAGSFNVTVTSKPKLNICGSNNRNPSPFPLPKKSFTRQ